MENFDFKLVQTLKVSDWIMQYIYSKLSILNEKIHPIDLKDTQNVLDLELLNKKNKNLNLKNKIIC